MSILKLPIIELTAHNPPGLTRTLKTRGLAFTDFLITHVKIPERMQWTASSVRMFRSCPRKFFWKYILRLRPHTDAGKDVNLVIGGAFHHCLAKWYTHPRSVMKKIVAPFQRRLDSLLSSNALQCRDQKDYDKIETSVNTFTGMMLGYEHAYNRDRTLWQVPRDSVEKVFVANCGDFDYTGKIDIVPSLGGTTPFIVEHKSASRVSANEAYLDRLTLDIQVRGYVFGARHGLGIPAVNEVLYDVVMKSMLRRKGGEDQNTFNQRIVDDYTTRQQHYFHREPLRFPRAAINEFELELRQVHADYQRIVWPVASRLSKRLSSKHDFIKMLSDAGMMPAPELAKNPSDPRAWRPDDSTCNDYFRLCEYYPCCTDGLTQSVSRSFSIGEHMHEELHDEA
jgi:hypothetical protein